MTLEAWANVADIVGGIGVVASLIYVGIQIRDSNRVNQANARHSISEFVLQISMFNAEHAERLATLEEKAQDGTPLTTGEESFRFWNHTNFMLHAETYFHHHESGLMPAGHWDGYVRFVEGYSTSPGFVEYWQELGPAYSRNFYNWMTSIVNRNNELSLPSHDKV